MSKRILVVEDDLSVARLLQDNLVYEGFVVECVPDGAQALQRARTLPPDLVLLDVMIPGLDGFEVCRSLNVVGRDRVPVIIVSARVQREDRVRGLALGADDYVTKPFALDELLARIHAVLRRSQRVVPAMTLGQVLVDFQRMRASKGELALSLTPREFALLQHLAERAGRVVTRDELLRAVWGYANVPLTRTVDNFIARLRRKIEDDPHHPQFIRTVHGDGYSLILE